MANTLFLRLEGPLQAWGERARWSVRDSAPEPTKSGVVGLLGCALGLKADEDLRDLSRSLRMGVRCDRPGSPLVDYHTVCGGVLSAEGKVKKTASTGKAETVVSHRSYLCDACFLVALQVTHGPNDLIERLATAVQQPNWPVYLGRKSCVPSVPVFAGVGDFPSLENALAAWPAQDGNRPGGAKRARAVIECSVDQGVRRRDEVESNHYRTFGPRHTVDAYVTLPRTAEKEA